MISSTFLEIIYCACFKQFSKEILVNNTFKGWNVKVICQAKTSFSLIIYKVIGKHGFLDGTSTQSQHTGVCDNNLRVEEVFGYPTVLCCFKVKLANICLSL